MGTDAEEGGGGGVGTDRGQVIESLMKNGGEWDRQTERKIHSRDEKGPEEAEVCKLSSQMSLM